MRMKIDGDISLSVLIFFTSQNNEKMNSGSTLQQSTVHISENNSPMSDYVQCNKIQSPGGNLIRLHFHLGFVF